MFLTLLLVDDNYVYLIALSLVGKSHDIGYVPRAPGGHESDMLSMRKSKGKAWYETCL